MAPKRPFYSSLQFLLLSGFVFQTVSVHAQEFELELPEGAKTETVRKKQSQNSERSVPKKDSALKKLADAELYLYSQTHESLPLIERLDQLEKTLFGTVSNAEVKVRLGRIADTISGGNARIVALHSKNAQVSQSDSKSIRKRKWWQVFGIGVPKQKKVEPTREEQLLRDGRRLLARKKWKDAGDKFSEVLILDPSNPEALLKSSACEIESISSGESSAASGVVDRKLVQVRQKLEKALRLYTLARKSEEALETKKLIERADALRHRGASAVSEDF